MLPPFDSFKECPKCGYLRHMVYNHVWEVRFCRYACVGQQDPQHLHITCGRCGYQMIEACKDTKPVSPAPPPKPTPEQEAEAELEEFLK